MKNYDAIIVGSGFGGGAVGLRLSAAGFRVLMLERGRRWRGKSLTQPGLEHAGQFPEAGDRHFFWGRQAWAPWRQRLGLYEMRQLLNLQGLVASGVGGGSLIWANVVVEAPEWVFDHGWPSGINLEVLRPYYAMARRFLRPSPVPGVRELARVSSPDLGEVPRHLRRAALHKSAAERIGRPWHPVEVAVNFGDERLALPNGFGSARQLGCTGCGMCTAGCPQSAKNTVDLTYLAQAESQGLELRPLHQVSVIEPLSAGGFRVHFTRFEESGSAVEVGFVEAPKVVLCAGAFATTELLLQSQARGLLSRLSPALGSRFSINGNVLGGALDRNGRAESADTNSGPSIASLIDFGRFAIEDLVNPVWLCGMMGGSSSSRVLAFIKAYLGFKTPPERMQRLASDMLMYVGVGFDGSRGRLSLNRLGGLHLNWPGGLGNEPVLRQQQRAMEQIARALNREFVPDVLSTFGRQVTYHPLGGCPMGDSGDEGVVDHLGRVFGYPGLYVADGSIVPTALARNPAYTIAALAERIAERMIA